MQLLQDILMTRFFSDCVVLLGTFREIKKGALRLLFHIVT